MSDSAMTGGDPETVDATSHQSVTNDAVAEEPVQNTDNDGDIRSALEAEAAEEKHLDDRHATGEHYVGDSGWKATDDDPLLDGERIEDDPIDDPRTNVGRGIDNI